MKYDHKYILDTLIPFAVSRRGYWEYVYNPILTKDETLFLLVNTLTNEEASIEELKNGYVVSIGGKEVYRSDMEPLK